MLALPTFARYAAAHDYDLFVPQESFFARYADKLDGRAASWLKVPLIEELLQSHDEVIWLDSDVIICRFDKDIADDLTQAPLHMAVHNTPDGAVPNCGVWHVRRAAAETLAALWQHNSFVRSDVWWEQAALIHVLGGNPDEPQVRVPAGPLWSQLPYEWNPHRRDSRGIPATCRFFHATMFKDRFTAMLTMGSR
jgi:hypothetical protein